MQVKSEMRKILLKKWQKGAKSEDLRAEVKVRPRNPEGMFVLYYIEES